jgi:hypothetical protein
MSGRPFRIGDSMRRKLSFAVFGLALTTAALVSGARPAQAFLAGKCTIQYCPDGITIASSCCLWGSQYICSLDVPCN